VGHSEQGFDIKGRQIKLNEGLGRAGNDNIGQAIVDTELPRKLTESILGRRNRFYQHFSALSSNIPQD
jgi:hypothetical protein